MIDLVRNAAAAFAELYVAVIFVRVNHGLMLAIFGQDRSWVSLGNYTEISRAGARSYSIFLLRGGLLGVAVCAQAVLVEEIIERRAGYAEEIRGLGNIAVTLRQRDTDSLGLRNLTNFTQVE